jgi:general secretion pathway protein M
MNAIQQWWNTLVQRERVVVALLLVLVIALMIQMLIVTPLYQSRDKLLNSVDKQSELLAWMQERSALAKQLKGNSTPVSTSNGSLSQRVNSSAKQMKLEINRFQTSGDNSVQVWLDNAEFSKLLLWLEKLEKRYAVQVNNIVINETDKLGFVSVRTTLSSN